MIQFIWHSEKNKITGTNIRSAVSRNGGSRRRFDVKRHREHFWGDGVVLYIEYSGGCDCIHLLKFTELYT